MFPNIVSQIDQTPTGGGDISRVHDAGDHLVVWVLTMDNDRFKVARVAPGGNFVTIDWLEGAGAKSGTTESFSTEGDAAIAISKVLSWC